MSYMKLDLANLESIHCFCEHFLGTGSRLDLLINNAGTKDTFDWLTADHASELRRAAPPPGCAR